MKHEFRLADIGEGLEEAEIIRWLVAVGDRVERDQPLIEVMTDKSNAELPAPHAGTVVALGGAVGDMITVGEIVAVIQGQTSDAQPDPEPVIDEPTAPEPAVQPVRAGADEPSRRPKASPSTRRAAADRGIDLTMIHGTGPGGRILLSDLDRAVIAESAPMAVQAAVADAPATPAAPAPLVPPAPREQPAVSTTPPGVESGVVPLRGVRRAVAKNMAQSWSEIPHIHAFEHIDAEPLLDLRQRLRTKGGNVYGHVTPLTFFVAAVAQALARHPQANASLSMADETITYHDAVHIGVAVAADHGLVVPVLHHVDSLDFATLTTRLAALVQGARAGTLQREHFLGGTVTITNFGALGGEQAMPLIRPPESMIVGFGSIAQRPFVSDGQVVARSTMNTVIGTDHRLLDGDITTAVLTTIGTLLADPLQLVL